MHPFRVRFPIGYGHITAKLHFFHKCASICQQPVQPLTALFLNQPHAITDRCHQHIRRAARLKNSQITFQFLPLCQIFPRPNLPCCRPASTEIPIPMQQCSLRHRRQCLVYAVNYQVSTQPHRTGRICVMKSEMRAMRLIHDKGHSMGMGYFRNSFHIGHNSLISRGCDNDGGTIRILLQRPFHRFRFYPSRHPGILSVFLLQQDRQQINRFQFPQISRMIYRFMAITRHQNTVSSFGNRKNSA